MITRLRAFSLRFKQSILRVWSLIAVALMTLLLLVPEATGEFVNGIPGMLRYVLVVFIYVFLVLFYPQFRIWKTMNLQSRLSRPAPQSDRTKETGATPQSRPMSDPIQEALEARKRRAGLLTTDSEPASEPQTEAPAIDPSIKLADWTQDQGDSEDDFYAMLGGMAKDQPSGAVEDSPSESSIVDDVLKNRQANSNNQT